MALNPALSDLRLLDIDDIIILALIGHGHQYKKIAKTLGKTSPAISHRIKKYHSIFPGFGINQRGSLINPNDIAKKWFAIADVVLVCLSDEIEQEGETCSELKKMD